MIKTLVVAAALTVGLAADAVTQQAPPAPPAHHLPPIIRCADCLLVTRTVTIRCAIFRHRLFRHRRRSNRSYAAPTRATAT